MLVLFPAGIFYLFIFPAVVAKEVDNISIYNIAFAGFLLIQLWMVIAEFAYESAASLFGLKRKRLFSFLDLNQHDSEVTRIKSGFGVLFLAFLSYLFMVYGYGIIYVFISNLDSESFSQADLGIIDGVYFSLITSSTVGYGDITPRSVAAKLTVMTQIIVSMFYILMLFSSAVSYIRENNN